MTASIRLSSACTAARSACLRTFETNGQRDDSSLAALTEGLKFQAIDRPGRD